MRVRTRREAYPAFHLMQAALTVPSDWNIVNRRLTMKWSQAMRKQCCRSGARTPWKNTLETQEACAELAKYAKALGHPMRVRILCILARQAKCICGDMVALLPVAQSTVSQHLKVLKNAGLVQGEIDGPRVRYCIEPDAVKRLKTLIRGL